MKRILSSYYTKLFVFCQVLVLFMALFIPVLSSKVSAANANDFYFEDAVFDYYLEKADDGTGKMHVTETLTAVFPDTNQNHGITRSIPYTNQGGENTTVANKFALNFKVKRNGQNEDIAKSEEENGSYIFYIGNKNTYVHGRQVYTLDYDFTNVITAFDNSGNLVHGDTEALFQEIYWDTNGTGWSQKFESLTANLHLPADIASQVIHNKTSCYVGSYGSSGQNRCTISRSSDNTTITFKTEGLKARENLTFAVDFNPGTFIVKAPQKSPILLIITIANIIAFLIACGFAYSKYYQKNHENKSYYKSLFVAPQYQPYKDLTVAEAGQISVEGVKDSKVATLLELATSGKIQIVKSDKSGLFGKAKWKIKVLSAKNLTSPQTDVLKLLRGGAAPDNGEEFEVKTQSYSSSLARIKRSYATDADALLRQKKFLGHSTTSGNSFVYIPIIYLFAHLFIFTFCLLTFFTSESKYLYFFQCLLINYGIDFFGIFFAVFLQLSLKDYSRFTKEGLDLSNYLQGLKLYIKMAEKDRIALLQSVKGADASDKGVIKLYEKLLPYACLFGEEKSWMNELNKYYERISDYEPNWYSGTDFINGYMLGSIISSTNSSISSGTTSSSSSSSSSSGGGGGGFSGGGGGGGGGGGW